MDHGMEEENVRQGGSDGSRQSGNGDGRGGPESNFEKLINDTQLSKVVGEKITSIPEQERKAGWYMLTNLKNGEVYIGMSAYNVISCIRRHFLSIRNGEGTVGKAFDGVNDVESCAFKLDLKKIPPEMHSNSKKLRDHMRYYEQKLLELAKKKYKTMNKIAAMKKEAYHGFAPEF